MDPVRRFLEEIKGQSLARGNFLGLLNVLIGRRIQKRDGTLVDNGIHWRELAALLKKVRWDKEAIHELQLDPTRLPPRDRQRYWYAAIVQARVDSLEAFRAGERMAQQLRTLGYEVGAAPGASSKPEG
jgi:hypothetical protein